MTDFFQEVEEDVRRQELQKLWRRYGVYVIGFAVALVAAVGGTEAYRHIMAKRAEGQARAYLAASDELQSDPKAAEAALDKLADKKGGYGLVAEFRLAQIKGEAGDIPAAVAIYDKIASKTDRDDPLHGLAILKSGYLMLDSASLSGIEDRLEPVASGTGPWRHAALEVLAFAALKAGDTAKARERFDGLAKDVTAPPSMAARARDMETTLGGPLPEPEPASSDATGAGSSAPAPAPQQP